VLGIFIGVRTMIVGLGNRLIVTNQRLIFCIRSGLFKQSFLKVNYEQIKDVGLVVRGFVATVFRLGILVFILKEIDKPVIFSGIREAGQLQELILQLKSSQRGTNWQDMDDYQLIELARKIRERLGRDVFRGISEERLDK
ncbi:MAG: PH domain-containing protein, partial [Candidatus Parcubacteria bacterium]|nr:PH domain-containing protein [Candidatus Parcubacteria bacterium]